MKRGAKKGHKNIVSCNCKYFEALRKRYNIALARIQYLEAENNNMRFLLTERGIHALEESNFQLQREIYRLQKEDTQTKIDVFLQSYTTKHNPQ